jgi:hypothetical protein
MCSCTTETPRGGEGYYYGPTKEKGSGKMSGWIEVTENYAFLPVPGGIVLQVFFWESTAVTFIPCDSLEAKEFLEQFSVETLLEMSDGDGTDGEVGDGETNKK